MSRYGSLAIYQGYSALEYSLLLQDELSEEDKKEIIFLRAVAWKNGGYFAEAASDFSTILVSSASTIFDAKRRAGCYYQCGLCYYKIGNKAWAVQCFEQAFVISPRQLNCKYYLGEYLLERGKCKESITRMDNMVDVIARLVEKPIKKRKFVTRLTREDRNGYSNIYSNRGVRAYLSRRSILPYTPRAPKPTPKERRDKRRQCDLNIIDFSRTLSMGHPNFRGLRPSCIQKKITTSVLVMQRFVRMTLSRAPYLKLRSCVLRIAHAYRTFEEYSSKGKKKGGALLIQRQYRRFRSQTQVKKIKAAVSVIQRWYKQATRQQFLRKRMIRVHMACINKPALFAILVKALQQFPGDLEVRVASLDYCTVFQTACRECNTDGMKLLCKTKADLVSRDRHGRNALHHICVTPDLSVLATLTELMDWHLDISSKIISGVTIGRGSGVTIGRGSNDALDYHALWPKKVEEDKIVAATSGDNPMRLLSKDGVVPDNQQQLTLHGQKQLGLGLRLFSTDTEGEEEEEDKHAVLASGWLRKYSQDSKEAMFGLGSSTWRKRYVTLTPTHLSYYSDNKHSGVSDPKFQVNLQACTLRVLEGAEAVFLLDFDVDHQEYKEVRSKSAKLHRTLNFKADNELILQDWLSMLGPRVGYFKPTVTTVPQGLITLRSPRYSYIRDSVDAERNTPIHTLVYGMCNTSIGESRIKEVLLFIAWLVNNDCNINANNRDGRSALNLAMNHLACLQSSKKSTNIEVNTMMTLVKGLLLLGSDPAFIKDTDGRCALKQRVFNDIPRPIKRRGLSYLTLFISTQTLQRDHMGGIPAFNDPSLVISAFTPNKEMIEPMRRILNPLQTTITNDNTIAWGWSYHLLTPIEYLKKESFLLIAFEDQCPKNKLNSGNFSGNNSNPSPNKGITYTVLTLNRSKFSDRHHTLLFNMGDSLSLTKEPLPAANSTLDIEIAITQQESN